MIKSERPNAMFGNIKVQSPVRSLAGFFAQFLVSSQSLSAV